LLIKKVLTLGIILLFISVGINPAISKEETQEFTLMVPNIFGIKKQQISLTSEQSEKLDDIFNELREQLKTVGSIEETIILFNRTIDILYENDLLSRFETFLTKKLLFSNIIEKSNCWMAGETTKSDFIWVRMFNKDKDVYYYTLFLLHYSSMVFFSDISFGYSYEWDVGSKEYWSNGWISTVDINGFKDLNGTFRGGLSRIKGAGMADYYIFYYGVRLFLGIGFNGDKDYFLGRACLVDVYEKPDV
jgi:hypothetical protein